MTPTPSTTSTRPASAGGDGPTAGAHGAPGAGDPASAPSVTDATRSGGSPSLARQMVATFPQAVRKLDPRHVWRSPVVFVVWVGSLLTTVVAVVSPSWFAWLITVWLWATVLFANMAEAVAEGRGRAQAATLRATRTDTLARRRLADGTTEQVSAADLSIGDLVVVSPGEVIPGDGDVVEGMATVDESAITGESAPVIRESGGDRCAVTGGTTVLSDGIVVRVTTRPG